MYEIIVTDLDGTVTEAISSWRIVHKHFECEPQADENYALYKDDRHAWMLADLRIWEQASGEKVTRDMIRDIVKNPALRPHAKEVFAYLHQKYTIYLLTQAIDIYADIVAKELAITNVIVDRFKYDEQGIAIGVDESNFSIDKAASIELIANSQNVPFAEIVAIGDTEFDVPMFKKAGLSIAINNGNNAHLKPIVDHYINDLSELKKIL